MCILHTPQHNNHIAAIIGAGMGGTSSAYFLRQQWTSAQQLDIDVYEKHTIGGRAATISMDGRTFESGGSVIHPMNMYMTQFASTFGVCVRDSILCDI
jgi:prenylcysteine oxidase/farnesylcysteine lyase